MRLGHRLHEPLVLAGILLLTLAAGMLPAHYFPFLQVIENWVADIRVHQLLSPEPQDPDIAIVTITEDTLARLPYRQPVDRAMLADVVEVIARAGPRALGIDLLFDQPTDPAKDQQLQEALARFPAPVVVSWADEDDLLSPRQVSFMRDYLQGVLPGYATILKNGIDLKVRKIYPGREFHGQWIPGFPGAIADALGIPAPRDTLRLAYRGRPDARTTAFPRYPAHTLALIPTPLLKRWLGGRIVLIGADTPHDDRHGTPVGLLPGVVIHAHALSQFIHGRQLRDLGATGETLLVLGAAFLGLLLSRLDASVWTQFALGVLVIAVLWTGAFFLYDALSVLIPVVSPSIGFATAMWLGHVYTGYRERRQKRFLQAAFSRYVSPSVVKQLVANPDSLSLGGERRPMSLLFTDIADFTTLSEQTDPAVLTPLLNDYLGGIVQIVFAHGGTIDKFIGDAVFAFFNAPVNQPDHPTRAVACALAIDRFANEFRERQQAAGIPLGITRIGLHTGEATVGNFGGERHFDYTALGDAVNTASRMEGVNKVFGTHICVSGETVLGCPDMAFRPIGDLVLKGKHEPVPAFEPLSPVLADAPLTARYREAFELFKEGMPLARTVFELDRSSGGAAGIALEILNGVGGAELREYTLLKSSDPGAMERYASVRQRQSRAFASLADAFPEDPLVAFHAHRVEAGETSAFIVLTSK